jgi:tetratricopeptide (TPR) repeat protein
MARCLIALALIAIAAPAALVTPAAAQGVAQSRCAQGSADACTAAIESGRYGGEALAGIYAARGQAYAEAGRHGAALDDFTSAIAADPRDALYLVFRGKEFEAQGRTEAAIADFRAALALSPTDSEAGAALARLGSAPVVAPAARGDGLTARIVADPAGQYAPAKAAFAGMLDANEVGVINDVAHCASGGDFLGVAPVLPGGGDVNWRFPLYADLAYDLAAWRLQLTAAHYPDAVWAPLLEGYEQARLVEILARSAPPVGAAARDADAAPDDVQDASGDAGGDADDRSFETRLLRTLDGYRAAHPALRLARFVRGGGCSGDDPPARVTTKPDGGVVRFIPMFYYRLCQAEGLDADDPAQCDRWRELREGVIADVAGDYAYEVRWPDGTVLKGRLAVGGGDEVTLAEPAAPATASPAKE